MSPISGNQGNVHNLATMVKRSHTKPSLLGYLITEKTYPVQGQSLSLKA